MTFHGAFPKQTGFYGPNEARGLIAIVGEGGGVNWNP